MTGSDWIHGTYRRLRRTHTAGTEPLRVAVEHLRDAPYDPSAEEARAITMEIIATLKELLHMHPIYNEQLRRHGRSPVLGRHAVLLLLHLDLLGRFMHDLVHSVSQHFCSTSVLLQDDVVFEVLLTVHVKCSSYPKPAPGRSEPVRCAAQLCVKQHKLPGSGAPGGCGCQHEQRHRRGAAGGPGGAQRACAVRRLFTDVLPALCKELLGHALANL